MHKRWTDLRREFEAVHAEVPGGAGLTVMEGGEAVLELTTGEVRPGDPAPWTPSTLVMLASATKAMAASALLLQVERGAVELDRPVARYWPAFGQAGKERITVRELLAHRAGVVTTPRPLTVDDKYAGTPITEMLAARRPDWEPGRHHGYHAVTFGWLVSGLVEAVTGSDVFDVFERDVARPYGLDLTMRLRAEDLPRVATPVVPEGELAEQLDPAYADYNAAIRDPRSLLYRATFGATAETFDDITDLHALLAPDPSGGGHGSASGLAGLYAALTTGLGGRAPLLSSELVRDVARPASDGPDEVLRLDSRWGLGFMLPGRVMWPHAAPGSFGHAGASGSIAYADPARGLSFAYTPSAWTSLLGGADHRAERLIAHMPG